MSVVVPDPSAPPFELMTDPVSADDHNYERASSMMVDLTSDESILGRLQAAAEAPKPAKEETPKEEVPKPAVTQEAPPSSSSDLDSSYSSSCPTAPSNPPSYEEVRPTKI